MKKIFNNTISKIIMLISFTLISVQAWADGGEPVDTLNYSQIINRPDFWIGVVALIGFVTAALVLGKERKQA